MIVAAKTDPQSTHGGVSRFVVEDGTPGFEKGRKLAAPIDELCSRVLHQDTIYSAGQAGILAHCVRDGSRADESWRGGRKRRD